MFLCSRERVEEDGARFSQVAVFSLNRTSICPGFFLTWSTHSTVALSFAFCFLKGPFAFGFLFSIFSPATEVFHIVAENSNE